MKQESNQPVVAESDTWWSCVCGGSNMPSFKLCYACDRPRPVATLPACLCGLDTNPVASPRMDIHCPKHDAPEAGSEPELKACPFDDGTAEVIKDGRGKLAVSCSTCYCIIGEGYDRFGHSDYVFGLREQAIRAWNTRVSQPADWLKDKEIERLTDERNQLAQQGAELWERANTAQLADEPSDVLVSRAEAARAVCVFCADTNRYEAPQRTEGSTRLWHRDKMNSNHGVEQCHAAAILALPAAPPASTPADEEFQPWYENYERALRFQSRDEEVARENLDNCICAEPQPCEASVPMHYQDLLRLVLGRTLAEARRVQGTPTLTR